MNKSVKGIAIVAAAMVTVGILLTGIGFMAGGNQSIYLDRDGIHVGERGNDVISGDLESFSQEIDSFSSINVDLDYYDVDLIPGDKFSIQGAFFSEDGKPTIQVENDTLVVKNKRNHKLNINIDLPGRIFEDNDQPNIQIYYPADTKLKDVVIRCDASDLDIENVTAEKAEFDLDLGKLELSNITANNITVTMDSGDCSMKGIKAADKLTVFNDLGKTTLSEAEMKTLKLEADSGEVVLTDTTFENGDLTLDMGKLTARGINSNGLKVNSNQGEVNLEGKLAGVTDVSSDMGAVTVTPGAPKEQFNYELSADMGSVSIGGDHVAGSVASSNAGAKNTLKITTDMGSINVNFN